MVMASLLFLSFNLVLCSRVLFLSSVFCFVLSCLYVVGIGCSGDGLGYSSHFFLSFVLGFCCFLILILIPSLRAPNYPCLSLPLPAFLLQLVICLCLYFWLFFCLVLSLSFLIDCFLLFRLVFSLSCWVGSWLWLVFSSCLLFLSFLFVFCAVLSCLCLVH